MCRCAGLEVSVFGVWRFSAEPSIWSDNAQCRSENANKKGVGVAITKCCPGGGYGLRIKLTRNTLKMSNLCYKLVKSVFSQVICVHVCWLEGKAETRLITKHTQAQPI